MLSSIVSLLRSGRGIGWRDPKGNLKKINSFLCGQTRISQAFPSRAGQESVKYESAQFLSGDGVLKLKHIEVDKDEQTRSLPAIGTRSRNKLEKYGLSALSVQVLDYVLIGNTI